MVRIRESNRGSGGASRRMHRLGESRVIRFLHPGHPAHPCSFLFSAAIVLTVFTIDARGQSVALLSYIGGSSHAVAVEGDHPCRGEGSYLAIIDVTDSARPRQIALQRFRPFGPGDGRAADERTTPRNS